MRLNKLLLVSRLNELLLLLPLLSILVVKVLMRRLPLLRGVGEGAGMNGLAVPLEPLRVDKGLGAEGAGVGPLARVDQAVTLEAGRVLVRLPTVRALVRSGKVKNNLLSTVAQKVCRIKV
jgi:hypothetical protein